MKRLVSLAVAISFFSHHVALAQVSAQELSLEYKNKANLEIKNQKQVLETVLQRLTELEETLMPHILKDAEQAHLMKFNSKAALTAAFVLTAYALRARHLKTTVTPGLAGSLALGGAFVTAGISVWDTSKFNKIDHGDFIDQLSFAQDQIGSLKLAAENQTEINKLEELERALEVAKYSQDKEFGSFLMNLVLTAFVLYSAVTWIGKLKTPSRFDSTGYMAGVFTALSAAGTSYSREDIQSILHAVGIAKTAVQSAINELE